MKTLEQIVGHEFQCLDGRDKSRFAQFVPFDMLDKFDIHPADDYNSKEIWDKEVLVPFTRENVLNQLKDDVEFGFEKALGKRGISASLMYECVSFWNWILEEGLEDFDDYAQYGLPLFKATAVKYGFDNPIGDDNGDEYCYSAEAEDY